MLEEGAYHCYRFADTRRGGVPSPGQWSSGNDESGPPSARQISEHWRTASLSVRFAALGCNTPRAPEVAEWDLRTPGWTRGEQQVPVPLGCPVRVWRPAEGLMEQFRGRAESVRLLPKAGPFNGRCLVLFWPGPSFPCLRFPQDPTRRRGVPHPHLFTLPQRRCLGIHPLLGD